MAITPLPPAPQITDDPATFNTKANAFVGSLSTFVTETNAVATQVDADAATAASAADAADAAIAAANFKGAWSSLTGALNIPASVSHNGAVWMLLYNLANVASVEPGVSASPQAWLNLSIPDQTSNGGKVLGTNGTSLSWVQKGFTSETRTTNASITSADIGKLLTYTSGGFTVALGAAASIGAGSQFAIKNNSAGNIILDPNATELFDGQSTTILYPGDFIWFLCDETSFITIKHTSTATFTLTSSQSLAIPFGLNFVEVKLVSGGGGGGSGNNTSSSTRAMGGQGGGGGGGAVKTFYAPSAGTATIVVGAGGTASGLLAQPGGNGGSSSFTLGSLVVSATGGAGGQAGQTNNHGTPATAGAGSGGDTNYTGGVGGVDGYSGKSNGGAGSAYSGGGGGAGYYHDGTTGYAGSLGGAGGSPYGGAGGKGSQSSGATGTAGSVYGGGGGGGSSLISNSAGTLGADGAAGIVYVRFG